MPTLFLTGDFIVYDDETYTGAPAVYWDSLDPIELINYGVISSTSLAIEIYNGFGLFDNRGTLQVIQTVATGSAIAGMTIGANCPDIVNNGVWNVDSSVGTSIGLQSQAVFAHVVNNTTISVHGHYTAEGVFFAWGGGVLINNGDIIVTAEVNGAAGLDMKDASDVRNYGLIQATGGNSVGMYITWNNPNVTMSLTNEGTLSGATGIVELESGDPRFQPHYFNVANTGTINGNINLGSSFDHIDTSGGVINGVIHLGTSEDSFIGGTHAQEVYGDGGDDTLTGGSADDTLSGGDGTDILNGGAGADALSGGDGNDTFLGSAGADAMNGGAGSDTASYASSNVGVTVSLDGTPGSGGDAQGDVLSAIENLIGSQSDDVLSGDAQANFLVGGAATDTLSGGDGNDSLDGGTGVDTMIGGDGNDTYYVDNVLDVITENAGQGADAALIFVSGYTLSANVEIAAVQGSGGVALTGNAANNILYGAGGADNLSGGVGDDTLQGGAGNDTMTGGTGNDTFYVAQAGDVVVENGGEGTDATIVQMTSAYTLAANIEIGATFLVFGANITGNGLDNLLYGNVGNDTLNGGVGNDTIQGGAGNDTMIGGAGSDTYFYENAGDVITENTNEGSDAVIVFTSSYTLAANVEVGARFLTSAYTLTGNALDNQLYGNAGDDTLSGGDGNDTLQGGAGNDTMVGGLGNDTYFVEQAGDVVTENASEGSDAVIVLINAYTLAANVEVGTTFLTSGVAITGNELNNRIYGNSGADTIDGAAGADLLDGGAGADTLTGGSENDTFTFAAGQADGDTITDFSGNGAAAGDVLRFAGYGTSAGGATFVQIDATHWQINSANGLIHDTIALANGAGVDSSDWLFV